jgi:uncharacterized protein (TIGR03437 family)
LFAVAGIVSAAGTPTISSVVNATLDGTAISPGCIATIFGSGLSDTTILASSLTDGNGNFVKSAPGSGVRVLVNGAAAPLIYVSPTQINFQIPMATPGGPTSFAETSVAGSSNALTAALVYSAIGIFANICSQVTGANCTLYVDGMGVTSPPQLDGVPAGTNPLPRVTSGCEVTVGDVSATVTYCGMAPGEIIGQINFIWPAIPIANSQTLRLGAQVIGCPVVGSNNNGDPVVTCTLKGLMFGVDPTDPTRTWTTTLRVVNRTATTKHNTIVSVRDANGNPLAVLDTSTFGWSDVATDSVFFTSPLGENRDILTAPAPGIVAASSQVTITSIQYADGMPAIVADALVQEADPNGVIVRSYAVVDLSTIKRIPGQAFCFGADVGVSGVDTNLILSNPNAGAANITVSIYDGYNIATSGEGRTPVASVQVPVSAGNTISQTLSQLFANSADLASFLTQAPWVSGQPAPTLQEFVSVTSSQPFTVGVSRLNANPGGSPVTTPAYAFPLGQ